MNKALLLFVAVGIVLIGVLVVNNNALPGTQTASLVGTDGELNESQAAALFKGLADTESYRITVATTQAGIDGTILIDYNAPATYHTTISSPQGAIESITDGTTHYTKLPGTDQWLKTESDGAQPGLSNFEYSFDRAQDELEQTELVDEGTVDCGTLTCRQYRAITSAGENVMLIDTKEDLIRQIVTTTATGDVTTMDFEYIPVDITIPTNIQTSPFASP